MFHYTTDHPARKQLFSLFRLFPQPHIALVMELLDEQQRHRQQDHARHAEGPEAGVHSRQRRKRGKARLGGHDLGLQKAAHSRDHRIQCRKSHRPGGLPQQQARRCPGQQHRPRAEHRQGVHQRKCSCSAAPRPWRCFSPPAGRIAGPSAESPPAAHRT